MQSTVKISAEAFLFKALFHALGKREYGGRTSSDNITRNSVWCIHCHRVFGWGFGGWWCFGGGSGRLCGSGSWFNNWCLSGSPRRHRRRV